MMPKATCQEMAPCQKRVKGEAGAGHEGEGVAKGRLEVEGGEGGLVAGLARQPGKQQVAHRAHLLAWGLPAAVLAIGEAWF